jgi:CRP/FNR family transcriptional regulator
MHLQSPHDDFDVATPCDTCPVREPAICAHLPAAMRNTLATPRRTETLRAGETFAWEGTDSVVVATIRAGVFKRSLMLADGREQVVGLAFPGDMVGRLFGPVCDHSLTAITDAVLCVFPRTAFERLAEATPTLEHALLVQALADLSRAQRQMLMLARLSAPQRVATFLLELVERSRADSAGRIAIPLSRQQLGDLLGLSIETVSRKLRDFERAGVIALPDYRSLVVRDGAGLAALAAA